MKLSIISVNYRAWPHLQAALDALRPGFPSDWEIIVVDNESQPEPLQSFSEQYPWVTFVPNPRNSGFGHGSNLGAARASGSLMLFMNPDVVATCDDLHALLQEKAEHSDVALLAPAQVDANGRRQKVFDDFPSPANQSKILKSMLRSLRPSRFRDPHASYDSLVYCDWVTGSCLLISRADFESLGGWCGDFWMYAEDADLCRRAADRGMRVAFTPRVRIQHTHGGSSRLNVDVRAMTKTEVVISKHVYASNHFSGARRALMHVLIAGLRIPGLLLASLADLLSVGQIPQLRVRSKMLGRLLRHYLRVMRTGDWRSPRALANDPGSDLSQVA